MICVEALNPSPEDSNTARGGISEGEGSCRYDKGAESKACEKSPGVGVMPACMGTGSSEMCGRGKAAS